MVLGVCVVLQIMRAGGAYEPTMADLSDYDPAVVMTLNSVKDLSQEAFEVRIPTKNAT